MAGDAKTMNLRLHVWRQTSVKDEGRFEEYAAKGVSPGMSFLEMLDVVNEELITTGKQPLAFDHDCREGICGACGVMSCPCDRVATPSVLHVHQPHVADVLRPRVRELQHPDRRRARAPIRRRLPQRRVDRGGSSGGAL